MKYLLYVLALIGAAGAGLILAIAVVDFRQRRRAWAERRRAV